MSTARMTLGALFGAIQTTAQAAASTVATAANGVAIIDDYVGDIAKKREFRSKASFALYREQTVREMSMTEAQAKIEVIKFCSESEDQKAAYTDADAKFRKLLGMVEE